MSNKSLTEIPKEFVKDAVTVRKSLLGYMGDKQMSFPETLAQNILMKGLDKPKVRDEVRDGKGGGQGDSTTSCSKSYKRRGVYSWP